MRWVRAGDSSLIDWKDILFFELPLSDHRDNQSLGTLFTVASCSFLFKLSGKKILELINHPTKSLIIEFENLVKFTLSTY